jgi:hypothetical protein
MSAEHLWDAWQGRAVAPYMGSRPKLKRKENTGDEKTWTDDGVNLAANVVCEECNTGWMHRLVDESKPILEPLILRAAEVGLTEGAVRVLSELTFLKSVVSDHMRRNHTERPPFFAEPDRNSFRQSRALPSGFQVWLAFAMPGGAVFKGSYGKMAGGFEMNVFTHGIQCLLLQAVTMRHLDPAAVRAHPPPTITQNAAMDRYIVEIWPPRGRTNFQTPSAMLPREIIDDFARRWERLEFGTSLTI